MARPLRIEYEGAFYHIIQRGTERKNIYKDDKDRIRFFEYIDNAHLRYRAIIHAHCLMDNHYHLIVETPEANITRIMHYLNTSYAAYYNAKHKRVGPLYQGRYKAIIVQADEYLHHLSSYIHLNPVRAKKVKEPSEYKWSSYNAYAGKEKKPKWLETRLILSHFGRKESIAQKKYKEYVISGIGKEKEIIKNNTYKGFILGDPDFVREFKEKFLKGKEDKEIPMIRELSREGELGKDEIEREVNRKSL